MMHRIRVVLSLAVVLVFAVATADAASPVVSNVTANQRAGTAGAGTIVDITYDVTDSDSESAIITIAVSNDSGKTFTVDAQTFTGDVGKVNAPGDAVHSKSVEWAAGVDVPGVLWEECQVKVTAREVPIVVNLPGGATMEMVWIEPGTFTMGSPDTEEGRDSHDEGPQHEVTITQGFYLGKFELTQGQWESVMGTTPWAGQSYVQEDPNNPAVYILWNDMQAFIDSLNTAEGSDVYRLPSEAEWEYACRAGTETRWSFGDDESQLGQYAWYKDNAYDVGEAYAHEVGTKLPNPWGLYDMHGNVWEWCQDWYDPNYYSVSPSVDPTGPSTPTPGIETPVARGGAFSHSARYVRSADRFYVMLFFDKYYGARLLRQGP